MKERPILFSAPMVRAILEGRKTQTRRAVKPHLNECGNFLHSGNSDLAHKHIGEWRQQNGRWFGLTGWSTIAHADCHYGQPGDRLWVRETYQGPLMDADLMETEYRSNPDRFHGPEYCVYAADGGDAPEFVTLDDELVKRWRPSIHMPRWASRILLEITDVRVERLQDITEADAKAEGALPTLPPVDSVRIGAAGTHKEGYRQLWESINGPGSWDANQWVWVVEFKRVKGGAA